VDIAFHWVRLLAYCDRNSLYMQFSYYLASVKTCYLNVVRIVSLWTAATYSDLINHMRLWRLTSKCISYIVFQLSSETLIITMNSIFMQETAFYDAHKNLSIIRRSFFIAIYDCILSASAGRCVIVEIRNGL
jgi:hypothetical protein